MKIVAVLVAVLVLTACAPLPSIDAPPGGGTDGGTFGEGPDYDRDEFGSGWRDLDRDCQDTRQEILQRDLTDVLIDNEGCTVLRGVLADRYTGKVIEFRYGKRTSDDVQIDHIIPLAYAWKAGAWEWTDEQRQAFANDNRELRAVEGKANNSKRDKGPADWLPPNRDHHCAYAAEWSQLADLFGLSLAAEDTAVLEDILSGCGQGADALIPR